MPADNDLISAIGRVIYNFAQLELCVGHIRRKLRGVARVEGISPENTAVELEGAIGALPWDRELVARLLQILRRHRDLKLRRDRLLCLSQHESVGTVRACGGEVAPELWRATDILSLAHACEVATIEANQVLRRYL